MSVRMMMQGRKPAGGGTPAVPETIAGLEQWLRADSLGLSNGASVSSWSDESGNGYDFAQATSANQPTFVTGVANGLPAVRTDGTNDRMSSSLPMTNTDNFTVFLAGGQTGTNGFRAPYSIGTGASGGYALGGRGDSGGQQGFLRGGIAWHVSGTAASTTPQVHILRRTSGTWRLYRNGGAPLLTVVGSAPNTPSSVALLGAHDNSDSTAVAADFIEIGCYSVSLSDADLNTLGEYLADRIGVTWSTV